MATWNECGVFENAYKKALATYKKLYPTTRYCIDYDVHVSVEVTSATQYNPDSWRIVGEHCCAFALLVQLALPMIMNALLYRPLKGQMEIDSAARAKWARIPISVFIS